ncbi:MAG: competence/damage-inducible protein A [Acidimicrobiales bacterium]|nr:competence/damage-inducible protein A [Acidimicrobiales bacterium]MCB1014589.1 competence/damage-inducible protein A [Acidimicrobiales bacterium]
MGTELLLGQIVDTNSSWIGEQLALSGIDSHFQTKVGDNAQRIASALRIALERSDAVIMCGGLGPTQDDITRDVIADVLGVRLVRRPELEERIAAMFGARNRPMPQNNLRQADVPEGAEVLAEMPGTAPGLRCPVGDSQVIYAVPGVPYEMKAMVGGSVLADLRARAGVSSVIKSRTLRTWGHSESGLAELLGDRIVELDGIGNPTLAFLASGIEGLKVRITAKAADDDAARALLDDEEARLREIIGHLVFGLDDQTMESVVIDLLRDAGLTLAVAESLTGGLVTSRLTEVPGSSDVLRGGVVSYASEVKHDLLDVPEGPVVSAAAAAAMADGVRARLEADVGIAVTGVAGPAEQEGQPVGTVFLGVALGDDVDAIGTKLPGDRQRIREFSTISLLNLLRERLIARSA